MKKSQKPVSEKSNIKNSLKKKTLKSTLIPLIIIELVALAICMFTFYRIMIKDVQANMEKSGQLVLDVYDRIYPGKFDVSIDTDTGDYTVLKGNVDIGDSAEMLSDISKANNVQISIFCRNIRVISTLDKSLDVEAVGGKCADIVKSEVLDGQKSAFYKNATIENTKIYAYYTPIILDDGTVYGMVGIARPSSDITDTLARSLIPLILYWIIAIIVIGFIITYFINKNVIKRIGVVQSFLKKISTGNFTTNVNDFIYADSDEISDLAVSGQKMQNAMRVMVEFDELTRIYNRRYCNKRLKQINSNDKNRKKPYCVGICDIDFFKKVNDTYGHDNGDVTLRTVSAILKKAMEKYGFVARWGGEEFIVVFDGYSLHEAEKILNLIRNQIQKTKIKGKDCDIAVTISSGITEARTGEKLDDIVKRADNALYYSKEHGRNQVTALRYGDTPEN